MSTHYNLARVRNDGFKKDSLEMRGHLDWVSLLSEEEHLHGSPIELVGHMNDLNDQLRKFEDDIYQSELASIIVWGTAKELAGCEENLKKGEDTFRGQ